MQKLGQSGPIDFGPGPADLAWPFFVSKQIQFQKQKLCFYQISNDQSWLKSLPIQWKESKETVSWIFNTFLCHQFVNNC